MATDMQNYKRAHWSKRFLNKHVPITRWLPEYDSEKFIADLIAGVTVGLTVMPQALAYATLAGLEPQVCKYINFNRSISIVSSSKLN